MYHYFLPYTHCVHSAAYVLADSAIVDDLANKMILVSAFELSPRRGYDSIHAGVLVGLDLWSQGSGMDLEDQSGLLLAGVNLEVR